MFGPFKIKSPIGRSYNVDGDDVQITKRALSGLGYYKMPDFGLTPYPDQGLMEGIQAFQSDFGLKKDGVMRPGGETETALNHVLNRKRVQGDRSRINTQGLYNMFDRFTSPGFHADGGAESTRCCATGTCDITW